MNKKTKILIGSFAGVLGVAGAATGLGVALSQQNQTSNFANSITHQDNQTPVADDVVENVVNDATNNEEVSIDSSIQDVPSFESISKDATRVSVRTTFDKETDTYTLKLINNTIDKGSIKFLSDKDDLDGQDTITAQPGQTIFLGAFANNGYTLKKLEVYGNNPNITLGVVEMVKNVTQGIYAFTIPNDDPENAFQVGEDNTINVLATFAKEQIASWTYNFNYKSYVLDLNKDLVLDDSNDSLNLAKFTVEELGTEIHDTVNFIIFLNGHNLSVKTFTIPSGVTLMLINNRSNTMNDGKPNEVALNADKQVNPESKGFVLGGVLSQYSSVKVTAPINSIFDFGHGQPR